MTADPICSPLWKWAGGKRALLPHLLPLALDTVRTGRSRYFEPFFGAGALFFAVCPPRAVVNDVNDEIVATLGALRKDNVEKLIRRLKIYAEKHSEAFFYQTRARKPSGDLETAARFLYLNRTCFNGLYRVNKSGQFNVPFGRYANPTICDEERIRACSAAVIKGVVLCNHDFEVISENATAGDFVYFDPPYVPLSATSSFTGYSEGGFKDADQVRLRDLALRLKRRSVTVVLSNSSADRVRELYSDRAFKIQLVDARRSVNSKGDKRGPVKEVIIT